MIYVCLSNDHFGAKYYGGIWICCKVCKDDNYLNDNTNETLCIHRFSL
jgi:hypothetical protein